MDEVKLELPGASDFLKNLEKAMDEMREKIFEAAAKGVPLPKPYFRARRKDFTKIYECDEYKCDAHPRGCLFCQHCTDVWWDYTNGPYMFMCELQTEEHDPTAHGIYGECKHFNHD